MKSLTLGEKSLLVLAIIFSIAYPSYIIYKNKLAEKESSKMMASLVEFLFDQQKSKADSVQPWQGGTDLNRNGGLLPSNFFDNGKGKVLPPMYSNNAAVDTAAFKKHLELIYPGEDCQDILKKSETVWLSAEIKK